MSVGRSVFDAAMFGEPGNYCGHCGARLPDRLVRCQFRVGGGTGVSVLDGGVNVVGEGGTGVSVLDPDGAEIHRCGAPETPGDGSTARIKRVDERHFDAWVTGPDGHRRVRGNRT